MCGIATVSAALLHVTTFRIKQDSFQDFFLTPHCVYLVDSKKCRASFLSIIKGHQFNFLCKQFLLITNRKKRLVLMKPHRELSYILPRAGAERMCLTEVPPLWGPAHFGTPPHEPWRVSFRGPRGSTLGRTPVAWWGTEVVFVPLQLDTFQIVLRFRTTYAS